MAGVGGSKKEAISLFLTPMLDIFSILITFLLMSFSTDPISHDVSAGLELPESLTSVSLDEIPTVIVNKNEIMVNDKQVVTLINGEVPERALSQGAIYPLYQELKKLAENNARIAKRKEEEKVPDSLTMELDKDHRYKLMKRIMLSAQQAEFVSFKLMVAKELD